MDALAASFAARADEIDAQFGIPGSRVFYLSIPPTLVSTCVDHLKAAAAAITASPVMEDR